MIHVKRYPGNPIFLPDPRSPWESKATFNGCPIPLSPATCGFLYRAVGQDGRSTIGYAEGCDRLSFSHRRQFIYPEKDFERYGCEDPRATKFGDQYYIFYTALSTYPFTPAGIRVGVAVTKDFLTIDEKHLVTPFNAKAMSLFPERIDRNVAAVVTVHTDMPPAKICFVSAPHITDLWSDHFWKTWYASLDSHVIPLQKSPRDQVEVGAVPIKTDKGWLLVYAYISDYTTAHPVFGIDACLLDMNDPRMIIGRLKEPLMVPQEKYELQGMVPGGVANVIFPSGAMVNGDMLTIYYGATDTTCCAAMTSLPDLLNAIAPSVKARPSTSVKATRFDENPLLLTIPDHAWEAKAVMNPAAIELGGMIHMLYRALSRDDTSVLGYAELANGKVKKRLSDPAYIPREWFEQKKQPGYSGCEDPRLTGMGDRIYLLYTAFTGESAPRVAMSSLSQNDFIKNNWQWDKPKVISPPGVDDKNACLFPEKINGKFVFLHRFGNSIWVDSVDTLDFPENHFLSGQILMEPRATGWDSDKIGIAGPPVKLHDGWLLVYHGLSKTDRMYRLGAAYLSNDDPVKVVNRMDNPILEPEMPYENVGVRPGTVFSCGSVVRGKNLYIYYGGADQVVCGASIPLASLLSALKNNLK